MSSSFLEHSTRDVFRRVRHWASTVSPSLTRNGHSYGLWIGTFILILYERHNWKQFVQKTVYYFLKFVKTIWNQPVYIYISAYSLKQLLLRKLLKFCCRRILATSAELACLIAEFTFSNCWFQKWFSNC